MMMEFDKVPIPKLSTFKRNPDFNFFQRYTVQQEYIPDECAKLITMGTIRGKMKVDFKTHEYQ